MWYRDSTSLLQIGQVLSRIKHLEPNTLQVGTLLSQYSHKKNIILGVVEAFQIHSQEIEDGFKGFNPLANKYANFRENEPSFE